MPLIEQVLEKNPQTVKVVFKNMPLRNHRMAEPSARAALAAYEQGKFWEYHDKLFAQKKITQDSLTEIAKELNLDMEKFNKDMKSPEVRAMLQKDLVDAQKAGVSGTPTIYINGRTPKDRSLEGLQVVIDEELAKKGVK